MTPTTRMLYALSFAPGLSMHLTIPQASWPHNTVEQRVARGEVCTLSDGLREWQYCAHGKT
jgi:hypothetical protein